MPKTASAAIINFLGSDQPFIGADLYVFTLYTGVTLYVTSLDRSVTYTGVIPTNPDYGTHTYVSLGQTGSGAPMIQRSKLSMAVGLTPSKIDIEIFARPGILVANQEILVTIAQGLWANAQVFVRRAFLLPSDKPAAWDTPWPTNLGGAGDGTLVWFAGWIGPVKELGPLNCKFEVRDALFEGNRSTPKRLFGSACRWALGDPGCQINLSSFTVTGSVQAGSSATVVNTGLTNDANQPNPPIWGSNPISQASTNVTIPATSYFVQSTYLTSYGETTASIEWGPQNSSTAACPPNKVITVASPPMVTGATGWNLYVSESSGGEQLQNGSPIPIGTSWTEPTNGVYATGVEPPQTSSTGWWALGVITITYTSGLLAGQTASAAVEGSSSIGAVTLRVPLPQIPNSSDFYSIQPGCDHLLSTCVSKYNNIIHFGGFPFIPVPESGA